MSQTSILANPFTLEALAHVSAPALVPSQQPTRRGLLQQVDCYQQRFLKYPGIAVCHSYAEFIHLICLEMDSDVLSFVPQPFKLMINGRRYIPDCYVIRLGRPQVIELKAAGGLDDPWYSQVAAFLGWHDLPFSLISNELMLTFERQALNWLPIFQALVCADRQGIDTQSQELAIWSEVLHKETLQVRDILNPGLRTQQWQEEIALYRLIYKHRLKVDLQKNPLDWDSELLVCT